MFHDGTKCERRETSGADDNYHADQQHDESDPVGNVPKLPAPLADKRAGDAIAGTIIKKRPASIVAETPVEPRCVGVRAGEGGTIAAPWRCYKHRESH